MRVKERRQNVTDKEIKQKETEVTQDANKTGVRALLYLLGSGIRGGGNGLWT